MREKDRLGRTGERLAAAYLEARGMLVLARNWRCPEGEIDIVAQDGGTLVFCEVKTRSSLRYGHPLEAVTPVKLARLGRLAQRYSRESGMRGMPMRIDVVGLVRTAEGTRIWHVRDASR